MSATRRLLLLTLPVLLLLVVHSRWAPAAAAGPEGVWPVTPAVVLRGFAPPSVDWQAGHRGVDLAAEVGDPVLAPAAGTVGFAAVLAGRGVVAIDLADGTRTTLEPVSAEVAVGDAVRPGDEVGTLGMSSHCGWTPCLHWGLRRGDTYLDPLTLLGLAPPVLLPLGGGVASGGAGLAVPEPAGTGAPPRSGGGLDPPLSALGGDGSLPVTRADLPTQPP